MFLSQCAHMRFEHTTPFFPRFSCCVISPYPLRRCACDVPRSVWSTGQDQCASIKRMLAAMLPGVSVFLDVRQRPIRPYRPLLCDRLLSLRPHTSSSHGTYTGVCYARCTCVIACGSRLAVIDAFLCFQPQQVDNLRSIDALEEEISATGVVMIYASKGYFKSKSKRGHSHPRAYIASTIHTA
jgi:hypothetical protein